MRQRPPSARWTLFGAMGSPRCTKKPGMKAGRESWTCPTFNHQTAPTSHPATSSIRVRMRRALLAPLVDWPGPPGDRRRPGRQGPTQQSRAWLPRAHNSLSGGRRVSLSRWRGPRTPQGPVTFHRAQGTCRHAHTHTHTYIYICYRQRAAERISIVLGRGQFLSRHLHTTKHGFVMLWYR